ncbi:MAG: trehalase family glycosidase [Phycisphaeraceae bacterium]
MSDTLPDVTSLPLYLRDELFACYVPNAWAQRNAFRTTSPAVATEPALPDFAAVRDKLPQPNWAGHGPAIDCYWKAWELAFSNLGRPTQENSFVASYIDTAFNGHLFMWDSVFILMFGRYGSRVFDFQRTLDNLYANQHVDGFICREIDIADGQDCFHRHDPDSTGPNALAWSEWEHFLNFNDRDRLERVFPVLVAYHQWMRDYRTWPDGTYWSCGWAVGMDNQPRVPAGYSPAHSPAHQTWMDACFQAILSARTLAAMAELLHEPDVRREMLDEADRLDRIVNENMWDDRTACYYDLRRTGERSDVMTLGAYWALLAEAVPDDRLPRFVGHLDDPAHFNRPHRVPSFPASQPGYQADGGYWRGGIWPSTQYMVLRGLTRTGHDQLAYDIARNHVDNVVEVFEQTGTLWENYAPETAAPGNPAKPDFVGWAGLGPIAILFEYVFGLRPDAAANRLVWDVRQLEAHGVNRYPFDRDNLLDLHCEARQRAEDRPVIHATSRTPIELEIRWPGGREVVTTPHPQLQAPG